MQDDDYFYSSDWAAALEYDREREFTYDDEHVYSEYEFDVPYVPTPQEIVDAMLRMAGTGPGDIVYDLGCGDGRIPITAAEKFGAHGVGVDIDADLIAEARSNASQADTEGRTRFIVGNLFETNIEDATVVTLYLLPEVNRQLKPRLIEQLKPGTRVVSHHFGMGDSWPADRTERVGNDIIHLWYM